MFHFLSAVITQFAKQSIPHFLYHAIKAGMDMGIVNAGQLRNL
jgi:cobalamin-dependent methionine synthase I